MHQTQLSTTNCAASFLPMDLQISTIIEDRLTNLKLDLPQGTRVITAPIDFSVFAVQIYARYK